MRGCVPRHTRILASAPPALLITTDKTSSNNCLQPPSQQELLGNLFIHPKLLTMETLLGEGAYATVHRAK